MPIGVLFWVLMVIWLLYGIWWGWKETPSGNYHVIGGNLIVFLLLFLVGWKLFGFVVQ